MWFCNWFCNHENKIKQLQEDIKEFKEYKSMYYREVNSRQALVMSWDRTLNEQQNKYKELLKLNSGLAEKLMLCELFDAKQFINDIEQKQ